MKTIVIGEETLVYFLAKSLISKGYEVTVVNRSKQACHRLSQWLDMPIVQGDGTELETLEDAGARQADILVALTPYDQDNFVACKVAMQVFGVPKTVALAYDPRNKDAFEKSGISVTLSITSLTAELMDQSVAAQQITQIFPLEQGRLVASRIAITPDAPSVGKSLQWLDLPQDSILAVIFRGPEVIIPRGNTVIRTGDAVMAISTPESQARVIRTLVGDVS